MSNFAHFMKQNKTVKENVTFAATKSLRDENGDPVVWEIRPVTTRIDEEIKELCTVEVPVRGKPNLFRARLNTNAYIGKLLAASVVHPDLLNTELQNSYGVMTPEDLLLEMIDDPGEYGNFAVFVQKHNGFDVSLDEKAEAAKN